MLPTITPDELPQWVPGQLLGSSDGLGWQNVRLRRWRYRGLDVQVPPLDHHVIVRYRAGSTPMARRYSGRWREADCAPGTVSLGTRAEASHWRWQNDIDVDHVYLSAGLLARVAEDMQQCTGAQVRLHDRLRVDDPRLCSLVDGLALEAGQPGPGCAMLAEALALQLSVHLLRQYADIHIQPPLALAPSAARIARVRAHVDDHLHEALTIESLAAVAGLGVWTFCRHFRAATGLAPHTYVMEQRLDRACRLLAHNQLPIKQVAASCGFADQAHLTRMLRQKRATTPARLRGSTRG